MRSTESKLLIRIGKHFEANASGNVAVAAVFVIVLVSMGIGYSFL